MYLSRFLCLALLAVTCSLSIHGCGDNADSATIRGCWTFYADECNTGFFIVVEDDPVDDIDEFRVTFTEFDLIADGEVFQFFTGARRVDLLSYQDRAFMLAQRDDLPGVAFDTIRFRVQDLVILPAPSGGQPVLPDDGYVEVELPFPVIPSSSTLRGLRVDFNVRESLIEGASGLEVDPFIVTSSENSGVELTALRLLVVDDPVPGEPVRVMSNDGVGELELYSASFLNVKDGDWIEIEGTLRPDGTLEADRWVQVNSGEPGLIPAL